MTAGWARKIRRADRTARVLSSDPLTVEFTARDGRANARARFDGDDPEGLYFQIEVRRLGIPAGLRIVPETAASLMWQRVKGPDVRVGDPEFDELAHLSGPPAWIIAALNVRARGQVKTLLEQGGRVEGERVKVRLRVARAHQLVSQSHHLLKLARRLSLPDIEVTHLLIRRAQSAVSETKRRAAVAGLIEHAPFIKQFSDLARVEAHLAKGTAADRATGQRIRLAWLSGDPNRISQLPESVVLTALDGETPTRLAAIERLAEIGTVASIAPLTAASRGFFTSSSVKAAAKLALEAVVARVGEVSAGGLALAEDTAGHLALRD